MPYQLNWLVENRILYMRDYDACTAEELEATLAQLNIYMEEGIKPIHLIHDNRHMESYPISIDTIKPLVRRHENTGWMMFIPKNKTTSFIVRLLATVFHVPARECRSLEEAIAKLQQKDPTLPADIPIQTMKL